MVHLNEIMHNAVIMDVVACTLYIVLHEFYHLSIIPSNNALASYIDKFLQYHYVLVPCVPDALCI